MEESFVDESQFVYALREVQLDPDVHSLLSEIGGVSEKAKEQNRETVKFSAGVPEGFGLLLLVLAPILYKWGADVLNYRRNKQELDNAKERIALVSYLVSDKGFTREMAESMVSTTMDAIAKRNTENDAGLNKILDLLSKINP